MKVVSGIALFIIVVTTAHSAVAIKQTNPFLHTDKLFHGAHSSSNEHTNISIASYTLATLPKFVVSLRS